MGRPRFLSVSELAKLLDVSPRTVVRLVEKLELSASSKSPHKRMCQCWDSNDIENAISSYGENAQTGGWSIFDSLISPSRLVRLWELSPQSIRRILDENGIRPLELTQTWVMSHGSRRRCGAIRYRRRQVEDFLAGRRALNPLKPRDGLLDRQLVSLCSLAKATGKSRTWLSRQLKLCHVEPFSLGNGRNGSVRYDLVEATRAFDSTASQPKINSSEVCA